MELKGSPDAAKHNPGKVEHVVMLAPDWHPGYKTEALLCSPDAAKRNPGKVEHVVMLAPDWHPGYTTEALLCKS